MKTIIEPKILKGTRDFLPEEMAKRNYVMSTIKAVFERFGYDTIETPVIEYQETLLGKYGEEGAKLTYAFEDNGKRKIALRYDQTVPTTRVVAKYGNQLPMPFKRYQISRVWRADKPAKGRYREFYQCDVDIIGSDGILADVEIAKVISNVFTKLGLNNFQLRFNSRKLINAILDALDVAKDNQSFVIQRIDKLGKIGLEGVAKELQEVLNKSQIEEIKNILNITGTTAEKLQQLKKYDISEVQQFEKLCREFGVAEENLVFDISIARGLDYYTGIIYEVELPGIDIGSVCGGGRYEDLCGMFTRQEYSGVGVAFGFDRIVLAMEELGLLKQVGLNAQVLVTYFDDEIISSNLEIVNELQAANINTELYIEPAKLGKQFKYANAKNIPLVIVCGSDEIQNDEVTIKNMLTGKQKTVPRKQLATYITGLDI